MKFNLKSYLSELLHNPELVIALIQLFYDGNNVVTIGIVSILKSFENIIKTTITAIVIICVMITILIVTLFLGIDKKERISLLNKILNKLK
ncbi:Uncharacterised protein [Streptococcus suis]|nr:Uncharacterised protein [Streptococcus suis]